MRGQAHDPHKLPVWRYDTSKHHWISGDPAAFHYRNSQEQQSLRVVTYNIWFNRKNQPLRFQNLCTILQHSKAHIICLQEITNLILKELILQPWVQDRYLLSDIDGRTFLNGPESYGVLMLIDKYLDLRQLLSFPFHTRQGRQLLFAQIQLRTEIFLIGTVHLESMRDGNVLRSHQLQTCQSVFNKYAMNHSNVTRLLMGDFNFDAHWPENATQMNILYNWIDLWPTLKGPNNRGLTHGNVRFDRIMFQSLRIIPIQIRIIGNKPIGQFTKKRITPTNRFDNLSFYKQYQDMRKIYPSDHFGLMADFNLSHI